MADRAKKADPSLPVLQTNAMNLAAQAAASSSKPEDTRSWSDAAAGKSQPIEFHQSNGKASSAAGPIPGVSSERVEIDKTIIEVDSTCSGTSSKRTERWSDIMTSGGYVPNPEYATSMSKPWPIDEPEFKELCKDEGKPPEPIPGVSPERGKEAVPMDVCQSSDLNRQPMAYNAC